MVMMVMRIYVVDTFINFRYNKTVMSSEDHQIISKTITYCSIMIPFPRASIDKVWVFIDARSFTARQLVAMSQVGGNGAVIYHNGITIMTDGYPVTCGPVFNRLILGIFSRVLRKRSGFFQLQVYLFETHLEQLIGLFVSQFGRFSLRIFLGTTCEEEQGGDG